MQKPCPTITPRPTLEIVPATPGALAPLIATLAAIVRRVCSAPVVVQDIDDAKKRHMLESAAHRFGHDALFLEFAERRGVWDAWMNEYCVYDEHAADALGLALAAAPSVQVVG